MPFLQLVKLVQLVFFYGKKGPGGEVVRVELLDHGVKSYVIDRAGVTRFEYWGQDFDSEAVREFELVREDKSWRIFLDWASGVRISFDTAVPDSALLQAKPVLKEVAVTRGKLFNVFFKVRNTSSRALTTWIVHHVEPKDANEYLELVECNLLFPIRLQPGQEAQYPSSYLLRGDLAEDMRRVKVTYEFKVEER